MELLRLIGSSVCHQATDRTLTAFGQPLPLCARCTGIYLGVVSAIVCLALTGKLRAGGFPTRSALAPLLVGPILNLADVVIAALGVPDAGGNVRRLILGAALGSSVMYFLIPACVRLFASKTVRAPSVKSPLEAIGAVTLSVVATMSIALEGASVSSAAGIASVIVLFGLVATANLAAITALSRVHRSRIGLASFAAVLALSEIGIGCAARMLILALL